MGELVKPPYKHTVPYTYNNALWVRRDDVCSEYSVCGGDDVCGSLLDSSSSSSHRTVIVIILGEREREIGQRSTLAWKC